MAFPVVSGRVSVMGRRRVFLSRTAGGYDAIWLLLLEPDDGTSAPLNAVEQLWESFPNVTPLLATESKERGAKVEDIDQVPGLRAIVQLRR